MTPVRCSCGGTFTCSRVLPGFGTSLNYEFRCSCGQARIVNCAPEVDPSALLARHMARSQLGGAFGIPPAQLGETCDPPKLTGKVIGFRAWRLEGYTLKSGNGQWTIGVNRAECRADVYEGIAATGVPPHEAPRHDCTCGLYAWYDPTGLAWAWAPEMQDVAFGAVTAWGQIESHRTGFRAEFAEPVVLAYYEEQSYAHVRDLKAIAGEMGVPCVPLDELYAEALKHGQLIPEELRPAAPIDFSVALVGPWRGSRALRPRPTWKSRLPMPFTAAVVSFNAVAAIRDGSWISGAGAIIWTGLFLIALRSYRRRFGR